MRIIHCDTDDIDNPLRGGQPVRTFEVNSRLAERHDIRIYTATYPGCRRRLTRGRLDYRRLGITVPGLGLSPHLSFLACLGPAVKYADHDLVVEEFTPPLGFCLLPLWTRRPVVCLIQWFFFDDWEHRYRLPFERMMRALAPHLRYRAFIVQSRKMGEYFADLLPAAHIWRVPCGLDEAAFHVPCDIGDYALFLGRLDVRHKGLDWLLDAWQSLASAGERIPLRIAGAGPGEDYLRRRIAQAGLADLVRLEGRVEGEAKARLLRGCRFLVMPSRQETFGMVALEAMAASRPVVAFDIDHLNEVVTGQRGILIKPGDVASFAGAAQSLWNQAQLCHRLGRQAYAFACEHRWDAIAGQHEEIYLELAQRGESAWV